MKPPQERRQLADAERLLKRLRRRAPAEPIGLVAAPGLQCSMKRSTSRWISSISRCQRPTPLRLPKERVLVQHDRGARKVLPRRETEHISAQPTACAFPRLPS